MTEIPVITTRLVEIHPDTASAMGLPSKATSCIPYGFAGRDDCGKREKIITDGHIVDCCRLTGVACLCSLIGAEGNASFVR